MEKTKVKRFLLFTAIATMLVSFAMAIVLAIPKYSTTADGYYYQDEPAEQSLSSFATQFYTWDVAGYTNGYHSWSDLTSVDSRTYVLDNGGTFQLGKNNVQLKSTANSYSGITESFYFDLDFSGSWGKAPSNAPISPLTDEGLSDKEEKGYFMIELGNVEISIHKDINLIKLTYGGRWALIDKSTVSGLSELTGMQKVIVRQKLIYSDAGKTTAAGVSIRVTIGDLVYSYDDVRSQSQGRVLFIKSNIESGNLKIRPLTYFYENDPEEQSLYEFSPNMYDNGYHDWPSDGMLTYSAGNYMLRDPSKSGDNRRFSSGNWTGHTHKFYFYLDFSGSWGQAPANAPISDLTDEGLSDKQEKGYFIIGLANVEISIHKDINLIKLTRGGRWAKIDITEVSGLSSLTGMQRVTVMQKLVYSNSAKSTPVGVRIELSVANLTYEYEYIAAIDTSTGRYMYLRPVISGESGGSVKMIPNDRFYGTDPAKNSLSGYAPYLRNWTSEAGEIFIETNKNTLLKAERQYYLCSEESASKMLMSSGNWSGIAADVTFWLDFSGSWGKYVKPDAMPSALTDFSEDETDYEYGYFIITFGNDEISIHKDADKIKMTKNARYTVVEIADVDGLSSLTGMQKVNLKQVIIYADETKTREIGVKTTLTIGAVEWEYEDLKTPSTTARNMYISAKTETEGVKMQGTFSRLSQVSISAAGDVGLNFYAILPESTISQSAIFTREGKDDLVVSGEYDEGVGAWAFTCPVAAKDYDLDVNISLTTTVGSETLTATYSVADYASALSDSSPAYGLTTKLIDYCDTAKKYFAGDSITPTADLSATDLTALAAKQATVSGTESGVAVTGASLLLKSKVAVRVFFTAESIEGLVCKINDVVVTPEQVSEGKYVIQTDGIAAKFLGDDITIKIGGITATLSVYSYIHTIISANTDAGLVETVKALYLYGEEAKDYFA